jgi:hypothetical protein
MSELSPEARALFRAARRARVTPPDAPSRVRAGLELELTAATKTGAGSGAWLVGGANAKPLAALLVVLSAAWGVDSHAPPTPARPMSSHHAASAPAAPRRAAHAVAPTLAPSAPAPAATHAPELVHARASAPVRTAAPVRAPVRAPAPIHAPVPSAAFEPSQPSTAAPAPSPSLAPLAESAQRLADEIRLVSSARRALRSGDATGALHTLDEHARGFPEGALTTEASAVRVLALCALGRAGEARALAQTWLATSPRSPLASAVRRSCGGDGE